MRKYSFLTLALLMFTSAGAMAQDDGVRDTWSVSVRGGAIMPLAGDLHEGGSGTVLGLPTSVDARGHRDIYDAGIGFGIGLGYGLSRHAEVFGEFNYGRAKASELSVGNVAGLDLRARFANYTSRGLEGGLRWHFAPDAPIRPSLSLLGGVKWIEAIPATFTVPAADVILADTPFYGDSVVPVFGSDVGLAFAVAPRVTIGVDAGVRYHTKLESLNGLAGTGLENLNAVGDRWAFPIVGTLQVRF